MLTYYVLYLRNLLMAPLRDEKGQDLVEYALIIALIALMLIVAIGYVTGGIEGVFERIRDKLGTLPGTG